MLHLSAIKYRDRYGEWQYGVAVIESPGTSNVLALISADGKALTAGEDGNIDPWQYELLPSRFAASVSTETE